ncbi:histone-lysine N-methyltransferase ash1 isoform X1 [Ceratitis capitata]|uniref:histone-lysine N-methyltransferase ash1 isoform X1 n=1 Tax=Ceratitis capitata TaxID=7213 RepID=UPI000A1005D5|nr:histone-lysine N-methyltransferase ash1 isoform X1 [Ceratitis capitata]XP_020713259.1 histone-lysine N-methyltransferase ash1 isoform X1 [Ceratitis capitata]XP_020713260.1 histone-lysine N-methyltransferase ash1 isoform X1 [Ceratitis capitata]XP_020713261.1 histone-lysine N-methyltransferase ash1 isoform X1 [Ceratitis capitata]
MNKTINELGAENVLDTQSQDEQKQTESISENEESDSVTEHSSSSSSETTTNTQNSNTTNSKRKSTSTKSSNTVTQFSVQRSDVDGLRMKISAIRPTPITKTISNTKKQTKPTVGVSNLETRRDSCDRTKTLKHAFSEKVHYNNNTITKPLTVKLNNIKLQKQTEPSQGHRTKAAKDQQTTSGSAKKMSVDTVPQNSGTDSKALPACAGGASSESASQAISTPATIGLPLVNLLPQAPCLSDATAESGCSEATTTTVAAGTKDKSLTRRVRVKRKKAQSKLQPEYKKPAVCTVNIKSVHTHSQLKPLTYSSDSDDDVPIYKQKQIQQQLQKRAPRILLTAINTHSANEPQIKPLACSNVTALASGSATFSHGSDNSDNELKLDDVVNAVIKRVESDGDDTPTGAETYRKTRTTKRLPQYQSTLLQDFMEKTQMLGSSSASTSTVVEKNLEKSPMKHKVTAELIANSHSTNSQTDSVASSGVVPGSASTKKKRGRPKKFSGTNVLQSNAITSAATSIITSTSSGQTIMGTTAIASNINESADSGVISTTSTTTQSSTSPSPKLTCAISSNTNTSRLTATTPSQKRRHRILEATDNARQPSVSPSKSQTQDGSGSCSASSPKPKIDIAYLDKRMYAATERVLYPPPRNKRRQSLSASGVNLAAITSSKSNVKSNAALGINNAAGNPLTPATSKAATKEELQLDPVWRKIDVNKKFRRPSVSGYKSDGGGGNTTICSKILAAKSGYVSDYGSFHARAPRDHSGYKSDASGKSRYSMKSCASRRSRAKSCGYRSDYKDGKDGASLKSKYRRKRRSALLRAHSKSVGNLAANLNDVEKDLLQLAGLSLGQSSEESNEYVCKPNLESLPTTSASKKYGEINRFIATGEYFGRGSSSSALTTGGNIFAGSLHDNPEGSGSHDSYGFSRKLLLQRKHTSAAVSGGAHDLLLPHAHASRKIKSRRSSVASYCSSFYSTTSKVRRRRRRKSFLRYPSSNKGGTVIDSKLLTEIDILINTFSTRCRIQSALGASEKPTGSGNSTAKEKGPIETGGKAQSLNTTITATTSSSKREQRDKRSLKKRKMSENQEYALLAGVAGAGSSSGGFGVGSVLSGSGGGGAGKRRHKKANNSSSPDDHKLPLKKRHYLLTPGEKSTEAAVAAKLFGSTAVEAWAAAVASTKLASTGKSQHTQQFGAICGSSATLSATGSTHSGSTKSSKAGLTPKKRQFPQQEEGRESGGNAPRSSSHHSNSSPLRIAIDNTLSHKVLDISPISMAGSSKQSDVVHRKRSRLEVLVSKIVATSNCQGNADEKESALQGKPKPSTPTANLNQHQAADTPPPGVFEPSVALEIQIPPIAKLSEASSNVSSIPPVITKAEVNSPLMLQDLTPPATTPTSTAAAKTESSAIRVVENMLGKTGSSNLFLKRKRKKFNRTGFPNVRRRKKRQISEQLLLDIVDEDVESTQPVKVCPKGSTQQIIPPPPPTNSVHASGSATAVPIPTKVTPKSTVVATPEKQCDRVPGSGEASDSFLERANRTPRLSVVALERLRGTPTPSAAGVPTLVGIVPAKEGVVEEHKENAFVTRKGRVGRKPKNLTTTLKSDTAAAAPNTSLAGASKSTDTSSQNAKPVQTTAKKSTDVEAPTVNIVPNSATTKSSKRTKSTDKVVDAPQPAKTLPSEKVQPLAATNNALPRARGRKPKLSAAASVLKPTAPQAAPSLQPTTDDQRKKPNVETPQIAKQPSSPLAKQMRKPINISKASDRPASFSKSTVHKIITAKSLEAKVKLPAGIDPNTNFSCKIRLKRPSTAQRSLANALRQSMDSNGDGSSVKDVPQSTPEEIVAESAAKDSNIDYPEQDILPRSETPFIDSETATSDTSDEKCSTSTNATSTSSASATAVRKVARLKKNYLPAGLFSDYFKQLHTPASVKKSTEKKELVETSATTPVLGESSCNSNVENNNSANTATTAKLLPPPYCEQYFRRTQIDFQLPYDIWWAYTNSKLPTRITVPSWNYRKIRTNIYADAVRPNLAGLDHPTCNCKPDQGCGDNCLNRMVYTECSPSSCPARDKCGNQKIQRHEVAPGVERFMTTDKGWGVRTKSLILKGTYILEYVGEVVTEREFKDRMGTIYLNDTHHYCLHLDGGLVIDGHRMGSDGRFVNHSCQPNCEMQKWSVNGLSRMALFAKRNIEPGEEISYDYNFSLFNPSEGQPCRCNTPQCRGVIGGKSQRVKPLPIEAKQETEPTENDTRIARQRKRKARKNTERMHSKDVVVALVQQLSEREKKMVKQHGIFLVRNFEKIRRCKARRNANCTGELKLNGVSGMSPTPHTTSSPTNPNAPAAITNRRPSTPSSLAAQISALRSPRSIKTRGLTHAVQDPEVEKMAKIAVILREICQALEALKDPTDNKQTLVALALTSNTGLTNAADGVVEGESVDTNANTSTGGTNKKKKTLKAPLKIHTLDLKTVETNIEQGYYKLPSEFNTDMQQVFATAQQHILPGSRHEVALQTLRNFYEQKKAEAHARLLEIVGGDEVMLLGFCDQSIKAAEEKDKMIESIIAVKPNHVATDLTTSVIMPTSNEDIIRCICGLYKDEGLMIQCARCMVWQHTECTKADVNADNYLCERCEPRIVNREIPLDDYTEEGHRYYLTLMRGDLHVRQGDAVYVLRDIPIKDAAGNVLPKQKHTYETIGTIDYNECDIFRVERLWKNEEGKRFIFGHHFLRPHETFHEPSRRFYPNEVVRVPLYEIVPIELVIGRCWVLDRTTFCKGRPVECTDETHCYICELRVDKTARFFSKAKVNYPTCTKTYAFRKFPEKLKISKSYAPHDVDPALLKSKRQKTENETPTNNARASTNRTVTPVTPACPTEVSTNAAASRQTPQKSPQNSGRKRQSSNSPTTVHLISPIPPSVQTIKQKRNHLESVLKTMKLKWKNTQPTVNEQPIDLSYLLSGRGARQRKSQATSAAPSANSLTVAPQPTIAQTVQTKAAANSNGSSI